MDLTLRQWLYLGALVALLLAFRRLRGVFWLFSLLLLPGTLCHELSHLLVGWLLGGQPRNFTVLPKREPGGYVMGSVGFAHVRWYNAFFLGMAPLLLFLAALGLLHWRLGGYPAWGWREALWLYLIANLVYAALPSGQDLRIAARSPIGWLLLAGLLAYGGWRVFGGKPASPRSGLYQLQVARLSGGHAPLGNPGADIGLGQAHQVR